MPGVGVSINGGRWCRVGNGTRHCLAGVGNRGILSAFVTCYRIRLENELPDLGAGVQADTAGPGGPVL
jgi:hypothetical protein